ncbi:MAG: hypothetical protein J7639_32890 [Paenibacillaceae bacterium]|nr:hypothetical protein [Paenibacillaceae bacterium]
MCNASEVSDDRGFDFSEGDQVSIKFRLYTFDCPDIAALFRYFATVRQDLSEPPKWRNEIPFSAAWEIVEEKYNRENWQGQDEFYRSSISPHERYGEWQTGWVGGGMNTYPMLLVGDPLSKSRSISTLDFLFRKVQASSGFFYGTYSRGTLYGDDSYMEDNTPCVLLRKNADLIYFLGKQLFLQDYVDIEIPSLWKEGYGRACDAFVRLWENNGQFGQFIDIERETILIGGTASAGIAPAALALASKYWNRPDYLAIAEQAADYYNEYFVRQGVTTGGPGEICQCPDSESAFALLESYVVLYEITGKKKWLGMAEAAADLCASWCVSYDYVYPEGSEFKKLDLRSTGAVWASVQNKHAGPGICTLSGDSLFKLYRATGNPFYLDLLRGIAHNLPQYLSREDRPLVISFSWEGLPRGENSPSGRMGERVNTSDWEGKENIGGVDGGSCWCEVSLMLTYIEVPGVYIQKDSGFVYAFDHVDARVEEQNQNQVIVSLSNPTNFTAKVNVFIENETDRIKPLGENAMLNWQSVVIEPRAKQLLSINK